MTVTDATGATIGYVLPVNGRWAWWLGVRASLPRWADTEGDAVTAMRVAADAERSHT